MLKQSAIRLTEEDWALVTAYRDKLQEKKRLPASLNDALVSLVRVGLQQESRKR
jgi:hypothetical protein